MSGDLPKSDIGIDFERDFSPVYEVLGDKKKVVGELRKAAAKASEVFLATDLDREGEANRLAPGPRVEARPGAHPASGL